MLARLSLIVTALALPAAASAATYSAKPVAPVAAKRITQRDISWTCGPAACQGATDYGRPLVLCMALAREAGRIESFIVDGRALPVAQLDQCNRAAPPAPALARN